VETFCEVSGRESRTSELTVPKIVPARRRATSWKSPGLTMW